MSISSLSPSMRRSSPAVSLVLCLEIFNCGGYEGEVESGLLPDPPRQPGSTSQDQQPPADVDSSERAHYP